MSGALQGDVGLPSHFQYFFGQELGSAEGWQQAINEDLLNNMTGYNRFRPDFWQDLLRCVRNMHRHYDEIWVPHALEQVLGPSSDSVFRYVSCMCVSCMYVCICCT